MNRKFFDQLLTELDPAEAAQHSTINHHVEGMDYLCLHRSEKLTAKLYFIDPARIAKESGSFLVTPHTHRYAFESTVLAGLLRHARFSQLSGCDVERFTYDAETRARRREGHHNLIAYDVRTHGSNTSDDTYWVDTDEIHTLLVPYRPVLLGLVQFADTRPVSDVFIPSREDGRLEFPASRRPTAEEADDLRRRALHAIYTGTLS